MALGSDEEVTLGEPKNSRRSETYRKHQMDVQRSDALME